MKQLIIILLAVFLPGLLQAQETPLSSLYNNFIGDSGVEATEVLPGSTSFEWEKDMEMSQVKEMMQSIESIRIVKYKPDHGKSRLDKNWKKIEKAASDDRYKEVMSIYSDDVMVFLYMMKGDAGTTRELALLEKDSDGFMLLTMTGNMDFSSIFNHDNMQSLREMGEYFIKQKGGCEHHE